MREAGFKLPIAYDHDAAVADEYAVVVCPTLVFARRGGVVEESTVKALGEDGAGQRRRRFLARD